MFTLDEGFDYELETLYPVVIGSEADSTPNALRVALRPEGWFGWRLYLESDSGLIPPRTVDELEAAPMRDLLLGPGSYLVQLSYDPRTGAMSMSVDYLDEDGERSLHRRAVQLAATDRSLWFGAGARTKDGSRPVEVLRVESLDVQEHYVPVSTLFAVGTVSDEGHFLARENVNFDERIAVRLSDVGPAILGAVPAGLRRCRRSEPGFRRYRSRERDRPAGRDTAAWGDGAEARVHRRRRGTHDI